MEQNSTLARELVDFLIVNGTRAAIEAGEGILPLYYNKQKLDTSLSCNNTVVTKADQMANQTIKNCLAQTRIPIMSEEGRDILYEERYSWELYWLVDPLDGTREFIAHIDQFVISIALMYHNKPLFGIIYSPTDSCLYFSDPDRGSFKREEANKLNLDTLAITSLIGGAIRLKCNKKEQDKIKVAVTRSHLNEKTEQLIERLKISYPNLEVINIGSSLKMCMVAESSVDLYFRTTTLYDWDIAAGEAIALGAGANIKPLYGNKEISYNKKELIVRPFAVSHNEELIEIVTE